MVKVKEVNKEKNISNDSIAKETAILILSKDFDSDLRFSVGENGFYGKITKNLKGIYSKEFAKRLKQAFNKNNWKYRDLVDIYLKNNEKRQKIENFFFQYLEWQEILKNDMGGKASRKEFNISFHNKLALKLQERGIFPSIDT